MPSNNFFTANFKLTEDKTNPINTKYDLFDKKTLETMELAHSKRSNKREYNKVKIYESGHDFRYYQGAIRQMVEYLELLKNPKNRINTEYLVKNKGWVSNNEFSTDINKILAVPSNDKGLPSGMMNNKIESDDKIYGIRLNVYHSSK